MFKCSAFVSSHNSVVVSVSDNNIPRMNQFRNPNEGKPTQRISCFFKYGWRGNMGTGNYYLIILE